MLPGDEIQEKKHKNIKFLTAMDGGGDLSRQKTRKFAGLGASVFKVNFEALFPDQYGKKEDVTASQDLIVPEIKENEICTEVEVENTAHHKAIVRGRDSSYNKFKGRFETSISVIMGKFDSLR